MRVVFDAFWWHRGPIANRAVMREILEAWRRCYPEDEIVFVTTKHGGEPDPELHGAIVLESSLYPQALFNLIAVGWHSKRMGADLVLTHNFATIHRRSVVFIHDLMFEDHPEWFTAKENLYFRSMGLLSRFARVVTTSSRTEAARISRLHPALGRVASVGLAPSRKLLHVRSSRPEGLPESDGFLLTVGRLNRRKNLSVILESALAAETITRSRPLVIVGSSDYSGASASMPMGVREAVEGGRIIFLGRIRDEELRWLYENADAVVFMSRDEGYGLPAAEAALFDVPLIASDIDVMREVASPGTVFVGVDDVHALTGAMNDIKIGQTQTRRTPSLEDLSSEWDTIAQSLRTLVSEI